MSVSFLVMYEKTRQQVPNNNAFGCNLGLVTSPSQLCTTVTNCVFFWKKEEACLPRQGKVSTP